VDRLGDGAVVVLDGGLVAVETTDEPSTAYDSSRDTSSTGSV
jgi:hypothetical protein